MKQNSASSEQALFGPANMRWRELREEAERLRAAPQFMDHVGFTRTRWRELSLSRVLRGGRLSDFGRSVRYGLILVAGLVFAWGPAIAYLKFSKIGYTSHFSLILPGAGSSSSVSLANIGQATSAASSAYSSPSISPTVTYKNLIMSANVVEAAAATLGESPDSLPAPTIKLVDETSFITVEMGGATAVQARNRAAAIQDAFFSELNKLRDDEIHRREGSTVDTVKQYGQDMSNIRQRISLLQVQGGLNSTEQYNGRVITAETLKSRVAETEAALAKDQMAAASLAGSLRLTPTAAAITMKLHADPEFTALADATSKAGAALSEVTSQFGVNHPKVLDTRAQFEGARAQMMARAVQITGLAPKQLVGKIDLSSSGQRPALMAQLVNLTTEQKGFEGQLKSMRDELKAEEREITTLIQVAAQLDSLNRDYRVAEAVFVSALARVNTSKIDIFASYPMAQVTEAAVMPLTPSSPNKKMAIGAAAGSTILLLFAALLGWIRRPLIDRLLSKTGAEHVHAQPA